MTILKILPRFELRKQDNKSKRPTLARTGDRNRTGAYKIYFDDTNTIIFSSGSAVSYPSMFLSGSKQLISSSFILSSSIFVGGIARQGLSDNFIQTNIQEESYIPFLEQGLHEQDLMSSNFYKTGSRIEDVGFGFSSNLGNKTKIRLKLPVQATSYMPAQTASIYYYNWNYGLFEEIAVSEEEEPGNSGGYAFDSKLFGPFGTRVISGSCLKTRRLDAATKEYFAPHPFAGDHVSQSLFPAMQFVQTGSVLLNPRYSADNSQSLDTSNFIKHPFLIEKASIELPIMVGAGWSDDITRATFGDTTTVNSPGGFIISDGGSFDFGGPCITFSILRQALDNKRDLILSATMIPQKDNMSQSNVQNPPAPAGAWRYLFGYNSFSTPSAVVPVSASGFFTGSVIMNTDCLVSVGLTAVSSSTKQGAQIVDANNMGSALIATINPIGRSMTGDSSGRSYFGKEYFIPQNIVTESLNTRFFGSFDSALDKKVYLKEQHVYSPYLIYPNDKLILAISKHRPCKTRPSQGTGSLVNSILTGSHEFAIYSGYMYITLYGSLVRENKEFHDTLNQQLNSDNIFESIQEYVLDQYDVEYKENFSGTFLDPIITGSLVYASVIRNTPTIITGNREVLWQTVSSSKLSLGTNLGSFRETRRYERGAFNRFIQCHSPNERFYDSMMPKISEIVVANGGIPVAFDSIYFAVNTRGAVFFDANDSFTSAATISDFNWTKSFPFEPRYSSLKRSFDPVRFITTTKKSVGSSQGAIANIEIMSHDLVIPVYQSGTSTSTPKPVTFFTQRNTDLAQTVDNGDLPEWEVRNFVYGIGDLNTTWKDATTGIIYGTTNMPGKRYSDLNTTDFVVCHAGALLRGAKYGLINTQPQFSKAIFRKDHFGHMRDMLEQRLYSKFMDVSTNTLLQSIIDAKFVDSDGNLTSPEQTYSSNLNFEMTSSMPYFADAVKNREDPIIITNSTTVIV